jgi:outer membrane receptor for ferrienterochelin and colicins
MRNKPVALIIPFLMAAMAGDSFAQTPPKPATAASAATTPSPPAQLETVVIQSSSDRDDRSESTASKIVVTREDLNKFGDTSVNDVLNRVPGVTVTGSRGRGTEIRMRGLGGSYVSILLNGEPAPNGFSLDTLSPLLIDRIEVLRSPSADRSTQAIAGSINIILKQAARVGQKDIRLTASVEHGRGSGGIGGQFGDRIDDKSYTLAFDLRQDAFERPSSTRRLWTTPQGVPVQERQVDLTRSIRRDLLTLTPRLNWFLTDRDTLSFEDLSSFEGQHVKRVDSYTPLLGSPPPFDQLVLTQTSHTTNHRLRTSWERRFEEGGILETKLGGSQSKLSQLVHWDHYDETPTLLLRRDIDGPLTDRTWNLSTRYQWAASGGHAVSAGVETESTRRVNGRYQRDQVFTPSLTPDDLTENQTATIDRQALYLQDNWTIRPGWNTQAGARWERVRTGGGDEVNTFRNKVDVLSPILQSMWKIPGTRGDAFRLAVSRTYRTPSLFELSPRRYVGSSDNTPTSPDGQGNPTLRPELAWGLEAGYEHQLAQDAGLLAINGTYRRIKDVIVHSVYFDPSLGLWIARPDNVGDARAFTLELEAKVRWRKLWQDAPALESRASLTRNWSEVQALPGPDNRFARQNPASGSFGLDWRPEGSWLSTGASLVVNIGGRAALAPNQRTREPITRQLDAYAVGRLGGGTQLRLAVSNLLHQPQPIEYGYTGADIPGGVLHQRMVEPGYTTVRLMLEHKL